MAHNITFSPDAWADYLYWQSEDKRTLKRINKRLQELQRDGAVQGLPAGDCDGLHVVPLLRQRHKREKNAALPRSRTVPGTMCRCPVSPILLLTYI